MNKTFKYIVLLVLACFVGKANALELKTEVFSLLNLDYPGVEKVKNLHQEGKDADAAKALLDYYRARTNVKTPDVNLKKVTISKDDQKMADDALQHQLAGCVKVAVQLLALQGRFERSAALRSQRQQALRGGARGGSIAGPQKLQQPGPLVRVQLPAHVQR